MKKVFVLALMIFVIGSVVVLAIPNSTTNASSTNYATKLNNCFGLGPITYGWAMKNDNGQITGFQGINLGLGYSAEYFFSPLKVNTWNAYWGWGTVLLVIPALLYVGAMYVTPSDLYFGIELVDLAPGIQFGVMF